MADFFHFIIMAIVKILCWISVIITLFFCCVMLWRAFRDEPIFKFEETPTNEEIREAIEDTDLFRGLRECERTGVYTGIYRSYDDIAAEATARKSDECDREFKSASCNQCAYCEIYKRCTKVKR